MFLVGYNDTDISEKTGQLAKEYDLPFIDAESEEVPPEANAPSQRDIFFATKSDLVILVWDGNSSGTKQLHMWLQRHNRDHLMIYV